MKMSGSRQLSASQSVVWAKLNDVEVLKRCIPGCQSLEQSAPNRLKATVGVKIGPLSAKFDGDVELSNMDPPNAYRISGSGKGGAAGFATGSADVRLAPSGGGTLLSYDVDAHVGGKMAQLGGRLVDATAASLAESFFTSFAAEFPPPATAETASGPAGLTPAKVSARPASGPVPAWAVWVLAALAAAIALYVVLV